MDNISIEKVWEDSDILELEVKVTSKYVNAYQYCYIQTSDLITNGKNIKNFFINSKEELYVEFGKKDGNFTPAFSLLVVKEKNSDTVKIEVDLEIDDNEERKHRAVFYIESKNQFVQNFGEKLIQLSQNNISNVVTLN